MKNIAINYAGLTLKNPIIIGSSGLTNTVEKVRNMEKAGAGAVVLKSLFEEQILMESGHLMSEQSDYPEARDYIQNYVKANNLQHYLDLIKGAKMSCSIPVIASINCYDSDTWVEFARDIENAGADALEINIFRVATDPWEVPGSYEQLHLTILKRVREAVRIPLILKLGQRFSNIVRMASELKAENAAALVLFNRFYQPDIDIQKLQIVSGPVFSNPSEFSNTLRWVGIVSGQVPDLDIAASTGIHEPDAIIKALLGGATAVEICSAVYLQGSGIISQMLTYLEEWMNNRGYDEIADFRGVLNFRNIPDQSLYERVQFMKYFSNRD